MNEMVTFQVIWRTVLSLLIGTITIGAARGLTWVLGNPLVALSQFRKHIFVLFHYVVSTVYRFYRP